MSVEIANTELTNNFNTWRFNTNRMATIISNNVVTVSRAGSADRQSYTVGNGHIVGTFSANELRTSELRGGNTSTLTGGTITVASNTNFNSKTVTFNANTIFSGNIDFQTTVSDRLVLGDISRIRLLGGAPGQFLMANSTSGDTSDTLHFRYLKLRDITDMSSNSAHLILSGSNSTFSDNGDSPKLKFAGSNGDTVNLYLAKDALTNDSDLFVNLVDVDGDSRFVIADASNNVVAWINSSGDASFSGSMTLGDTSTDTITVKGHFANQSTSGSAVFNGTSTFNGTTNMNGGVTLGDASTDTITVKGNFANQSTTGTAKFNGTSTFNGTTNMNGDVTLGDASTDTITVKGNFANQSTSGSAVFNGTSTFNGTTNMNGTLNLNGNVNVGDAAADVMTVTSTSSMNGNTTIGNSVADTLTVNARLASDLTANGSYNLGSSTLRWSTVYATAVDATSVSLSGDQTIAGQLKVSENFEVTGNTNVNGTLTANNAFKVKGETTLDGAVTLGDASTDTITVKGNFANQSTTGTAKFNGDVTLGNANADTLTINAEVNSNIIPVTDDGTGQYNLGSSDDRWHNLYANNANINSLASDGTLSIAGSLSVDGDVTLGDATSDTITVKGNFANQHTEGTATFTKVGVATSSVASGYVADIDGKAYIRDDVLMANNVSINGNLDVVGSFTFPSNTAFSADEGTFASITVTGDTILGNDTTDTVDIGGSLDVTGRISRGDTTVIGSNGKLHANNTITDGTIRNVMLDTTGVTAASYGNTTAIPSITVNAQGRITAVSTSSVSGVDGTTYTQANNTLRVSTSISDYDVVISAATANTDGSNGGLTNRGVASFNSNQFTVTDGLVSIGSGASAPVLTINGTSNEIEVSRIDNTVTVGLPDDVTVAGQLNVSENVVISGNLYVAGATSTVDTTNMTVKDSLISLNEGAATNANDLGIIFNRGSTGSNGIFIWDESADRFMLGTGAHSAGATGNLTVTKGTLNADIVGDVTGNASTATALQTARTIAGQSFDGTANISIAPTDLTDVTASASEINILDGVTATTTELNYVDGVTSAIQTQLDGKALQTTNISAGTGLSGGGTLASDRTISLSHLGIESLSDPNDDNIMFWDDSEGAMKWLGIGDGLTLSGNTLSASASIDSDMRGTIFQIGRDTNDYYAVNTTTHDWYLDGALDMRLESDGDLHIDGDIISESTTTSSDVKLKENITTVENALDKVAQLNGVEFTWKKNGEKSAGVIAQDVEKVLPQAVKEVSDLNTGESYKTVKYDSLHALLIESIKELKAEIDTLKNNIK
jgi:hypothetical protein